MVWPFVNKNNIYLETEVVGYQGPRVRRSSKIEEVKIDMGVQQLLCDLI